MNDSFEIFIEFSLLDINKLFKFWDGFFWIPWNCIDIFKILERFPSDFYHLVTLFFFCLFVWFYFVFKIIIVAEGVLGLEYFGRNYSNSSNHPLTSP